MFGIFRSKAGLGLSAARRDAFELPMSQTVYQQCVRNQAELCLRSKIQTGDRHARER